MFEIKLQLAVNLTKPLANCMEPLSGHLNNKFLFGITHLMCFFFFLFNVHF